MTVGVKLTHYYLLFRVGRVAVKLYAAAGPQAAGLELHALQLLAAKVVARIRAVYP